jgi:hypothetical protein
MGRKPALRFTPEEKLRILEGARRPSDGGGGVAAA